MQLKPAQRAAAEQAWSAAGALLESGAQAAGLVLDAELLRAVHSCRLAALPRLSAAGQRTAQQLHDLHAHKSEFRLAAFSWDVHQLLACAYALRGAEMASKELIGEARRAYADVGTLQLRGLFTEAVVSTSGFAGVVSYVVDHTGTVWSLADVAPGEVTRCQYAYVSPIALGDTSLDHRALCRAGLELQHATAAANHRLGTGQSVAAQPSDGRAFWDEPLRNQWEATFEAQLDRVWAAREGATDERRAGDDLLFLRCRVIGADGSAVQLRARGGVFYGVAPSAHRALGYRHNLALLARAVGLDVWIIGRIAYSRPRTLMLLAVGGPRLRLPAEWNARANLGLDTLQPVHLGLSAGPGVVAERDAASAAAFDPLVAFKRRLEQVLLGGRPAISPAAWSGFDHDEDALRRTQLPTAALLLHRLREAPTGALAEAWLAARTYLAAAEAHLQRDAWARG
jgi:hypothetical protein